MNYNVVNYWNTRKEPNSVNTITNTELINKQINFFSSHLKENMNVLDIGPGTGRLARSYGGVNLTVFDISEIYKEKLLKEYKKYGINVKNIDIKKENWGILPYETNQFDVVTSSLVLLHQPPETIKNVMSEMLRVGKKFVCISTEIKTSSNHVFNHNYKKIVEGFDLEYNEIEVSDIGQIYFLVDSEKYGK